MFNTWHFLSLVPQVFCYALSANDGSEWRCRIEAEAEHFMDVSSWSVADIARRLSQDGIHIGVNLNGYTKGARNEIFALWPAPVQTSYMGFPATTGRARVPCLLHRTTFKLPDLSPHNPAVFIKQQVCTICIICWQLIVHDLLLLSRCSFPALPHHRQGSGSSTSASLLQREPGTHAQLLLCQ